MEKSSDIRNEPLISKKWSFFHSFPKNGQDAILITGANSFLGAHVVKKLQQQWKGKIYLLVRGESRQIAIAKMETAFQAWNLGSFESGGNTEIFNGEVCKLKMGLSPLVYDKLHKNVGYVLHLAMVPLYHLPYSKYKNQWLPELEQMIDFCANGKSLHYPSSYNANFFVTDEDFEQLNSNAWQSGYAGFKWVANQVIENAFLQGLKGCIYYIPLVVGSKKDGLCPENYSIWHILDIFLQTGYFIPYEFRIIPIDILAEIMVSNLQSDKNGKGISFIRPVLKQSITHKQFEYFASLLFGLKFTNRPTLLNAALGKRKFNFMIPENFYTLLEKVNALPAVLPQNIDAESFPDSSLVFLSNINSKLSESKYQKYFKKLKAEQFGLEAK